MTPAIKTELSPEDSIAKGAPVIIIEHLFKRFGKNVVLKDFNLTVHGEENVVVLGKSGAGKSVLIKCVIGLLKPDSGKILVFGDNVPDLSPDDLDKVRSKIGFLFQANALYDSMTVRENLEFPLRRHWIDLSQLQVKQRVAGLSPASGATSPARLRGFFYALNFISWRCGNNTDQR